MIPVLFKPRVLASALVVLGLLAGALAVADSIGTLFRTGRLVTGNGAAAVQSASYALVGTAGQLATREVAGDSYRARSGFWPGDAQTATAVDPGTPALPRVHRLEQNHPNPFNPTTTIRFALPQATRARLDVFDARGRRVRTLLDERQPAGEHEIVLDARSLASGVYWYRLQAGSFSATRQMVLVK